MSFWTSTPYTILKLNKYPERSFKKIVIYLKIVSFMVFRATPLNILVRERKTEKKK